MEREVIISQLISIQKNLPPGNKRIFDLEHVIIGLKNLDAVAFGHGVAALERVTRDYEAQGLMLLEEFGITLDDNPEGNNLNESSDL